MKNQYTGIGQALSAAGQGMMQYTQYSIEEMRAKNLEAIRAKERGEDIAWREKEAGAAKERHGEELQQRYDLDAFGALDKGLQDAGSEFSGAITKLQDRKRYLEQKAMDPEVAADPEMLKSIEKQLGNLDREESRYSALLSASRAKYVRNADPKWLKSRGYNIEDYNIEGAGVSTAEPSKPVNLKDPKVSADAAEDFNKWIKNNPGRPKEEGINFLKTIYGPGAASLVKFPSERAAAAPVAEEKAVPAGASEKPDGRSLDEIFAPRKEVEKTGAEADVVEPLHERVSGAATEAAKYVARDTLKEGRKIVKDIEGKVDDVSGAIDTAGNVVGSAASNIRIADRRAKLERQNQYARFVAGKVKSSGGKIQGDAVENLADSDLTVDELFAAGLSQKHVSLVMRKRADSAPAQSARPNPAKSPAAPIQAQPSASTKKPAASSDVDTMVSGAAEKHGIKDHAAVVMRMAAAESGGEKDRATATSEAGAVGVMQVLPGGAIAQAKQDGYIDDTFDPADPQQNIDLAAWYFKYLLGQFDGNVRKAVAAYNWGEGNVRKYGDQWEAKAPSETKNYVKKVLG